MGALQPSAPPCSPGISAQPRLVQLWQSQGQASLLQGDGEFAQGRHLATRKLPGSGDLSPPSELAAGASFTPGVSRRYDNPSHQMAAECLRKPGSLPIRGVPRGQRRYPWGIHSTGSAEGRGRGGLQPGLLELWSLRVTSQYLPGTNGPSKGSGRHGRLSAPDGPGPDHLGPDCPSPRASTPAAHKAQPHPCTCSPPPAQLSQKPLCLLAEALCSSPFLKEALSEPPAGTPPQPCYSSRDLPRGRPSQEGPQEKRPWPQHLPRPLLKPSWLTGGGWALTCTGAGPGPEH